MSLGCNMVLKELKMWLDSICKDTCNHVQCIELRNSLKIVRDKIRELEGKIDNRKLTYSVKNKFETSDWVATCKDFPQLIIVAKTSEEALNGIKELIRRAT